MSQTPDSAVRTYIEVHRAGFPDSLAEWLRDPSVSAHPGHGPDVRRSADRLATKLKETGFPTTGVRETPGAPAADPRLPVGHLTADTVIAPEGMCSEDTVPWAGGGGQPAHWHAPNSVGRTLAEHWRHAP